MPADRRGHVFQAGAEIFCTAGSEAKRDFLRMLGVEHVFDSRALDFGREVLEATGGAGVDVVLNSLAGEFISKSFDIFGRGLSGSAGRSG